MITIVDYGMGNLGSIANMLKHIGVPSIVTEDIDTINTASKVILPGVGAFDSAMRRINESGLREVLDGKALVERVPILGICLGMQLLTDSSEEGQLPGLGWIGGQTRRFPPDPDLKVPHMGWCPVTRPRNSVLTDHLPDDARYYFVHSYFVTVRDPFDSILKATYGLSFDAAIARENIFGAQFHPEKSHKFGMGLLRNFAAL